ncbi:serine hydrolase [Flexibacterium corallicola]|uniref:serine hydrolase n=1 Tax=Flexibacterium corallicola TaxID=3037259 RepID=UPI00286F86B9|nr:serine hydrolase [Pseudovibrio sp. M1P-2-3]
MIRKTGFAATAAFLLLTVSAQAFTQDEFDRAVEEIFSPLMETFDIPGLAVGITYQGKHYTYSQGLAERKNRRPVTGETIFELGSVSKTFAATVAALAEQRGVLDLHQPVSTYLDELKGSPFDRISVMDLATHTNKGLSLFTPKHTKSEAELLSYLGNDWEPLEGGDVRSYSNMGIGLLGAATASAMKTTYPQALEETLSLMGLSSTGVDVRESLMGNYAYGYARKGNKPIRSSTGIFGAQSYSVKSTANDMLAYLDYQLGESNLPSEINAAVERTHQGQTKTDYFTQAMVWERYPWPAPRAALEVASTFKYAGNPHPVGRLEKPETSKEAVFIHKTGSTRGFGAYIAMVPSERLGIVVLANKIYPNGERVKAALALTEEVLN